jgi:hypothetical protein
MQQHTSIPVIINHYAILDNVRSEADVQQPSEQQYKTEKEKQNYC